MPPTRETSVGVGSTRLGPFDFTDVNDLIERHNRWYPIESQLPMDPCSGEFALVNGRDYRLGPLDESWIIERFPPELEAVLPALRTAAT